MGYTLYRKGKELHFLDFGVFVVTHETASVHQKSNNKM